jgi:phospholipase C
MPTGTLVADPAHVHDAALTAYNDGGMNGFDLIVQAPAQDGGAADPLLPFRYYTKAQIPNYYAYAGRYALCDAFFTTVLSDSFPAYMSLIAGQSPAYDDPPGSVWNCYADGTIVQVPTYDPATCATSEGPPCFAIPSIVDNLPAGVTWRSYTAQYWDGPLFSPFDAIASVHAKSTSANTRLNSALLSDLAAGDLANLTYVWGGNESEHPDQDICPGENDTVAIATALMQGPHWKESLLIVTYDDWGGFYDHVAPTVSPCKGGGGPFNTGFRVPTLLISPWAREGLVYHTPTEQASIPRLIEDLFGLPRMSSVAGSTARDGRAGDLLGAFDFKQGVAPGLVLQQRACP